jgi:hypothetical protein
MMTTAELRRLLELAAKAIDGTLSEGDTKVRTGPTWDTWEWRGPIGINTGPDWKPYPRTTIHPQYDDGDSRRLEVKLNLQVNPEIQTDHGPAAAAYDGGYGIATEPHNGDPCAATRMAVLRAAAAIGEAMP